MYKDSFQIKEAEKGESDVVEYALGNVKFNTVSHNILTVYHHTQKGIKQPTLDSLMSSLI